mmetsp:Transcript_152108/g.268554  ORF Transcript_152108/g.268554 Transcript_152108/m.268554 type:complete len:257 (-) Transcript_152108:20-790(-)
MASPEDLERTAAIRRYRELLAEKEALARNLSWLRSQFPTDGDGESSVGSDLLFLADYTCKERHISVRGVKTPNVEDANRRALDLTVQQRMEKMSSVLWPSSCVLAEIVAHQLGNLCAEGADVLELGCGTAVPSIVAAALGANVLATDAEIASADLVIEQNRHVFANAGGGSLSTACLSWGDPVPDKPWALVLVSDAIYDDCGHTALAATLSSVQPVALRNGASAPPRILVAYQNRRPEVEGRFFCQRLREVGLYFH